MANVAGVDAFTAVSDDTLNWAEYGARIGYAINASTTLDVFNEGVSGEERIGTRIHTGADLRVRFWQCSDSPSRGWNSRSSRPMGPALEGSVPF